MCLNLSKLLSIKNLIKWIVFNDKLICNFTIFFLQKLKINKQMYWDAQSHG